MRDEMDPNEGPHILDDRLRAMVDEPVPDELLGRCLATVREESARPDVPALHPRRFYLRVSASAAAVLLIAVAGFMTWPAGTVLGGLAA